MNPTLALSIAGILSTILPKVGADVASLVLHGLDLIWKAWTAQGLPPVDYDKAVGTWVSEILAQRRADAAEEDAAAATAVAATALKHQQ